MGKKIIQAGIVGSGFAARFHYDALQRVFSTKVDIKGVYSINREELSIERKNFSLVPKFFIPITNTIGQLINKSKSEFLTNLSVENIHINFGMYLSSILNILMIRDLEIADYYYGDTKDCLCEEWYIYTLTREDFIKELYDK